MGKWLSFLLAALWSLHAGATHNRAGEITYRWVGGLTYEVTVTTYTKESAPTDRCDITINWGDNNTATLLRVNGPFGACGAARMGESLGNDFKKNIYRGTHTYPANGNYTISMEDPNRNGGVSNIPNSINVPFYIATVLRINPQLGPNSSPELLNPPIDDGCVNKLFVHNPSAYDVDGDSLGYSLVNCRGGGGLEILETYSPFQVQDPLTIDSITGNLTWNVPKNQGQFNFAIKITEYRKAPNGNWVEVGSVTRDLQVDIQFCSNNPPSINPVGPFCVTAGDALIFDVTATDPDGHTVTLSATGGPFEVDTPAFFPANQSGPPPLTRTFSWATKCIHVRKQPYFATFKVKDNPPNPPLPAPQNPQLAGFFTAEIQVVAPAPQNLVATPTPGSIDLSWDAGPCFNATGYAIYRKNGPAAFTPGNCETGLPASLGYTRIGTATGAAANSFTDTVLLSPGNAYCYRIVAEFADGAESYASNETCAELSLSAPLITRANVATTDGSSGSIDLSWIPPRDLDTVNFPPPYSYKVYRATGVNGTAFTEIHTAIGLGDTTYTDTGLNTVQNAYRYRVDLLSGTLLAGSAPQASSVFLQVIPTDERNVLSWVKNVPWIDTAVVIFRETSPGSGTFDSIATVLAPPYIDTGLVNGQTYCYRVQTRSGYSSSRVVQDIRNFSQTMCGTPLDTLPPCAPELTSTFFCERDSLILTWNYPNDSLCIDDVVAYNIYYKEKLEDPFPNVPFISNFTGNTLVIANEGSLSGCYAVSALDDGDQDPGGQVNEGPLSNVICVESCPSIKLPNVFSPNGDGRNDAFIPLELKDVQSIDLTIRNRWGQVVYATKSVTDFQSRGWDGKDQQTGQDVPEGVYFYTLTYEARSVQTTDSQVLQGFIHLYR